MPLDWAREASPDITRRLRHVPELHQWPRSIERRVAILQGVADVDGGSRYIVSARGPFTSNMPEYPIDEPAPTITASTALVLLTAAGLASALVTRDAAKAAGRLRRPAARCRSCSERLQRRRGPGRPQRFCGSACRQAAYRRRRQRLPQDTVRVKPGGRLKLRSRLAMSVGRHELVALFDPKTVRAARVDAPIPRAGVVHDQAGDLALDDAAALALHGAVTERALDSLVVHSPPNY